VRQHLDALALDERSALRAGVALAMRLATETRPAAVGTPLDGHLAKGEQLYASGQERPRDRVS